MGSENMGPSYGPQKQPDQPLPPRKNDAPLPNDVDDEDTQPRPIVSASTHKPNNYQEPAYREHVSGSLFVHPSDAPHFQPAYPTFPPTYGYPSQNPGPHLPMPGMSPNGYYPAYYMPSYPAPWPPKPKRDGYLFGVAIASFICTILVALGGAVWFVFLLLFTTLTARIHLKPDQSFAALIEFIAFGLAGLLGGGFGLYHSIRALFLQKPSADFKLPWFWLFLLFYIIVIVAAELLRSAGLAVANIPLTVLLILLCGILPALSVLALAVRRIHFPRPIRWPTSWRRVTLSLVSGATLAILLAGGFELLLSALTAQALHVTNIQLDNPNAPLPTSLPDIAFLFLLVSVIAPVIEESVKPLGVVILIGRVRSAAEAFVLGMAGGIGFDLVETSGYMAQGYRDWVDVAIQRTSAGLLHGLGAAMVALGWYYLTHRNALKKRKRILIALSCWLYAILQHAIWNGSGFLQLLPGTIGHYLTSGNIALGLLSFPAFLLVYALETALMLLFLLFITKRLRPNIPSASAPIAPQNQTRKDQPYVNTLAPQNR